jgi:hypothetical protein
MDPDADADADSEPAIFFIELQDANEKLILKKYFCLLLFEGTFTSFFKDKKSKRSHKAVGFKVFFNNFCLVIEGSGSIPQTNGSGSGSRSLKNIRIRKIRIQLYFSKVLSTYRIVSSSAVLTLTL